MNSHERFTSVLDGKKPDRIPFYIPTIACSVASEILGREAHTGSESLHYKEELALYHGESAHSEFVQKHREDLLDIWKKLGCDVVRETWRCRRKPSRLFDEYTLLFGDENGKYTVKKYFPEYESYGVVESNEGFRDIEELVVYLKNEIKREHTFSREAAENRFKDVLELKRVSDPYFPSVVGALGVGFPMEKPVWLEASALEQELLHEYFTMKAERESGLVPWLKEKGFRFINGGVDITTSTGPIFSPETFSEIIVPGLKIYTEEANRHGMIYCYKTDGNIWKIADFMFRDAGVHAYAEVDRRASMTVGGLRAKYPELIILGNISSEVLYTGTEQEVREETRATLEESGGYRYIAGPSNAIVHGTPAGNVYAMAEEIHNF